MPDLTTDQCLILTALAAADGPVNFWDLILKFNPEPKRRWGFVSARKYEAWLARHNELNLASVAMYALVDGPSTRMVITDAGRDALAAVEKKTPGGFR